MLNHVTIRLSYDQLALTDDRYDRKIASVINPQNDLAKGLNF